MNKERIFYIEWKLSNSDTIKNAILTFTHTQELFKAFAQDSTIRYEHFAFQDITDLPIEDFERRLNYNGKYAV